MGDTALHPLFQIACSKLAVKSPQIEKMQQVLVGLTSRYLQELAAAGTINDYHTNNETRLREQY